MISTVIFDLDGTLLYTIEDLTDSLNHTLKKYNFPTKSINEVQSFVGNGVDLLIERALPEGKNNKLFNHCLSDFKTHYSKNMYNKTKPYDGIIPMLKTLKSKGYKIGVVSNKFDSAVKELCEKYFDKYIDITIGQGYNGIQKVKPDPSYILEAMKMLNCDNSNCIFVGDSEVDIQTAANAEIPCISVAWGYKTLDFLYKNGAEVIIYSPEELLEII